MAWLYVVAVLGVVVAVWLLVEVARCELQEREVAALKAQVRALREQVRVVRLDAVCEDAAVRRAAAVERHLAADRYAWVDWLEIGRR